MSSSLSQTEEQAEEVSNKSIPKGPTQCEECKSNPSKYKCPGCLVHSCSLPCVKAHKERTGCTGKRNQTQFVPLSQFDDNILLSGTYTLETVFCLWILRTFLSSWLHKQNNFYFSFPIILRVNQKDLLFGSSEILHKCFFIRSSIFLFGCSFWVLLDFTYSSFTMFIVIVFKLS